MGAGPDRVLPALHIKDASYIGSGLGKFTQEDSAAFEHEGFPWVGLKKKKKVCTLNCYTQTSMLTTDSEYKISAQHHDASDERQETHTYLLVLNNSEAEEQKR